MLTNFNESLLINCVELFLANQQKQKISQSNKNANTHMALAVDVDQKQNYQVSRVLAPVTTSHYLNQPESWAGI